MQKQSNPKHVVKLLGLPRKEMVLSIAFVLAVIFVSAQDNTLEILGHDCLRI